MRQGHHDPGAPARQEKRRPAIEAAHDRPRDLGRRLPLGQPPDLTPAFAQRHLAKFAGRPARTRSPNPDPRPPQLVTQALDQTVDRVLAGDINRGITDADKAENRRDLKDLPGSARLHVPSGFLAQVDQGDHVELDDPADGLGNLAW